MRAGPTNSTAADTPAAAVDPTSAAADLISSTAAAEQSQAPGQYDGEAERRESGYKWRHRLSAIDDEARTGTCAECGPGTPLRVGRVHEDGRIGWRCGISGRQRDRRRRGGPNRSTTNRRYALKSKFGITLEQYDELLIQQDGVCAICERPCPTRRYLAVDHDHATGAVRGLLCNQCNRAIGLLADDAGRIRRALNYIAK